MPEELKEVKDQPKGLTRRSFMKLAGLGAAVLPAAANARLTPQQAAAAGVDRHAIVLALGDTMIPDDPDSPGYKSLEPYNITAEVMKGLGSISDEDLSTFNSSAAQFFSGKSFVDLDENQRADYLRLIIDGTRITDKQLAAQLLKAYRATRNRVMLIYYQNYPEHRIPRDKDDVPVLPAGDTHQITNPNTTRLFTAWDLTDYHGPLTWEEEERRRNYFKKIDWQDS